MSTGRSERSRIKTPRDVLQSTEAAAIDVATAIDHEASRLRRYAPKMAMLRSRRLEGLLGAELDAVTADHVRSLVELRATEEYDLDFKEQLYGRTDSDKRALAGDVAALANTGGGVIILGVGEDDQARACSAPGIDVSDNEAARMRQVVAAGVSPLPAFDIVSVLPEPDSEHGFYLIAVPKSVLAPHAVLVNGGMRFPMRNGSTTRYLSEPEVAAAYRTRLTLAAQRSERVIGVEHDLVGRLGVAEDPWLVVTLVPELPGDLTITQASFAAFEDDLRSLDLVPLDGGGSRFHRVSLGPEVLRADDAMNENEAPRDAATNLHTDGAGSIALRLYDIRRDVKPTPIGTYTLSDEGLAAGVVFALQHLAQHAQDRTHTSGTAALRATIVRATSPTTVLFVGHSRQQGFPLVHGQLATAPAAVSTYASVNEMADGGPGLIAAAARLHHGLGHSFGIPELPQLTLDGEFSWPHWNGQRRPHLKTWAATQGVTILGLPADR